MVAWPDPLQLLRSLAGRSLSAPFFNFFYYNLNGTFPGIGIPTRPTLTMYSSARRDDIQSKRFYTPIYSRLVDHLRQEAQLSMLDSREGVISSLTGPNHRAS